MNNSPYSDYEESLVNDRKNKDLWFATDFDSPFLVTNTPFHRLNYFEPNNSYYVKAKTTMLEYDDSVKLVTSSGEEAWHRIYGEARFDLNGTENMLQLLYQTEELKLFIPFMDKTSGKSTYGAGRYLETGLPIGNELILDFNTAINPYCAYMDGYSCPFPPKKNILTISIEAGEKSFTN